jgi:hypothetical protein
MPSYNQNFNQQSINDRIDNQIAQLQQMKEQMKHNSQPAINQTFQLAPQQSGMRYASSVDDVNKEMVYADTPFFSKDMSVVWIKNNKNEVKTYELNEIIPKDSKDLQIEYLQAQIQELRKEMKKNEPDANVNEPITDADKSEEPTDVSAVSKSKAKSK